MIPEIFDIYDGKVVINPNCLLIPELKAVYDEYADPIPAYCFLYYKFAATGPYCNTPEADKDEVLLKDFPGDYTLEDDVMIEAVKKLTKLYITTAYQYYLDNKLLMEKLGAFARITPITSGRDGNVSALQSQLKSVGKTIQEFKILEKTVMQELAEMKGRNKADKKLAYDQE